TRTHPSIGDEGRASLFEIWSRERESIGAKPVLEVLGTARVSANAAQSFVAMRGPRGARVMRLDWVRGLLIDSGPVPEGGLELKFFAERADTLARLDLWNGRVVRVAQSTSEAGRAS